MSRKGSRLVLSCASCSAFWACAEYLGTSITIGIVMGFASMSFLSLRQDMSIVMGDLDRVRTTQLVSMSEKEVE